MKIEGSGSESGSISQRHGSVDPDSHQNAMDPQHWRIVTKIPEGRTSTNIPYLSGSNHTVRYHTVHDTLIPVSLCV
jgi:hypothetical protein